MRILGIDHGTVRVGLALSDELGALAHPLEVVPEPQALKRIGEVVRERGVTAVVLGLPLRLDGTEGPAAERVRRFLASLRRRLPSGVPVHLRDESFSTVTAADRLRAAGRNAKRQKPVIDRAAAAVILQEYLDELAGPSIWLADSGLIGENKSVAGERPASDP
ncbi:MAG: Holliday junction resolvase RuvX [Verrucomicrobiales bacterium]